jgi:hypothetical protein
MRASDRIAIVGLALTLASAAPVLAGDKGGGGGGPTHALLVRTRKLWSSLTDRRSSGNRVETDPNQNWEGSAAAQIYRQARRSPARLISAGRFRLPLP